MKKIIVIFAIMLFSLTACGEMAMETMNCSYETASNTLSSRISYNIDYTNNMVRKMRITYDYININDTASNYDNGTNTDDNIDGIDTGTDGITSDNVENDNDEIIDGVVGSAIDNIVNAVSDTVLDVLEYKNRHSNVQNMYGGIDGFSIQNTSDSDDNRYTVTYVIDFDLISDDDLSALNLSRDLDALRSKYVLQGFTCS